MSILCQPDDSTLLLIDTQARLMPSIHDGENVIRRCVQLGTAARELGIHVIGTEENPDGLGPLVPEVAALCDTTLAKFHFSAPREDGFLRRLPAGRNTLVVAGCEAHVCVMQTVAGLLEAGPRGEVGGRRDRLAPPAQPARRDGAGARPRRRRRHDRDGHLRMAGHEPASEVPPPVGTDPLTRRRAPSENAPAS
jgi:hypothetical protein